mgnify:CR=1 FL=1
MTTQINPPPALRIVGGNPAVRQVKADPILDGLVATALKDLHEECKPYWEDVRAGRRAPPVLPDWARCAAETFVELQLLREIPVAYDSNGQPCDHFTEAQAKYPTREDFDRARDQRLAELGGDEFVAQFADMRD